jgi:hypothetical protein
LDIWYRKDLSRRVTIEQPIYFDVFTLQNISLSSHSFMKEKKKIKPVGVYTIYAEDKFRGLRSKKASC